MILIIQFQPSDLILFSNRTGNPKKKCLTIPLLKKYLSIYIRTPKSKVTLNILLNPVFLWETSRSLNDCCNGQRQQLNWQTAHRDKNRPLFLKINLPKVWSGTYRWVIAMLQNHRCRVPRRNEAHCPHIMGRDDKWRILLS